jgi:hypothetical protein
MPPLAVSPFFIAAVGVLRYERQREEKTGVVGAVRSEGVFLELRG